MRAPLKRFALALIITLSSASAFAWGQAGHLMSNEAATFGLPNDMPQFFYRQFPQLTWLGPDPDRWRGGGPAIEAANAPDHVMNYEYIASLQLPRDRYAFLGLLMAEIGQWDPNLQWHAYGSVFYLLQGIQLVLVVIGLLIVPETVFESQVVRPTAIHNYVHKWPRV